nr:MAG TPA: hypothetical protein [Bacteriophage sp.]
MCGCFAKIKKRNHAPEGFLKESIILLNIMI